MRYLQTLARPRRVDRESFLVDLCRGLRVLHLGCVDSGLLAEKVATGSHLHAQLAAVAVEIWGLDVDAEGVAELGSLGFGDLHVGSVEAPPPQLPRGHFELLVAGELIEHLRNPGLFLDGCVSLLAPGGRLVLTTPNALRLGGVLPALLGRELVHPEHLLYYSPYTLRRTLERSPFQLEEMCVYSHPPRASLARGGNPLGLVLRVAWNWVGVPLLQLAGRIAPQASDGLVAVARRPASPPRA